MKIKKVEIQAFRAYDELCVFDFETSKDNFADFISIYAPNGFGKTSFYDAVEWGMTNNIYRFTKNHTLNTSYALHEKQLNFEIDKSKNTQYILKNKNSPKDRNCYVKLHLANPDFIQEKKLDKSLRIDSSDYNFNDSQTVNKYFRNVILSQDSINAFLKEDQPEIRYKRFVDFFGDKDLDRVYTNILLLIRNNENKVIDFEKNVKILQEEIPLNTDHEIISKINESVIGLSNSGIELPVVNLHYTEQDFFNFSNVISDKLVIIKKKIQEDQSLLETLLTKELELPIYFNLINSRNSYNYTLTEFKQRKSIFIDIYKIKNDLIFKRNIIQTAITDKIALDEVIRNIPTYLSILSYSNEQQKIIEQNKITFSSKSNELNSLKNRVDALRANCDILSKSIFDTDFKLKELSTIKPILINLEIEIKELVLIEENTSFAIKKNEEEISKLEIIINSIEFEVSQLTSNQYPNSIRSDKEYAELVKNIDQINGQIKSIEELIVKNNLEIKHQNEYNNELNKLMILATNIINKDKDSSCPTCGFVYNSYDELMTSITNNPALNVATKILNSKKLELQDKQSKSLEDLRNTREIILAKKGKYLNDLIISLNQLLSNRSLLASQKSSNRNKLNIAQKSYREYVTKFENNTVDNYENILINKFKNFEIELKSSSETLNEDSKKLTELTLEIEFIKNLITSINTDIKSQEMLIEYTRVQSYLLKYNITDTISVDYFSSELDEQQRIISESTYEEAILKDELEHKSSLVSQYTETFVDNEIQTLQELIHKTDTSIIDFSTFLKNIFKSDLLNLNFESLKEDFTLLTEKLHKAIDINNQLVNDLNKLSEYKDNAIPYLKLMSIEKTILALQKDINFHKDVIGKELSEEKNKLSAFINNQIESFFYEELINKIYQKIDPHPEYKKISFKCDFTGEKPKLNVFVNGDAKEHLIPNLYFSTAQMNILSLSIFLAKALNAKDDSGNSLDCIFIDDPVQAMDSINILSAVDLIRSIVVNYKKQVILSTHDEYFYKLLERKMPTDLFNSKFIELETFGKVKSGKQKN